MKRSMKKMMLVLGALLFVGAMSGCGQKAQEAPAVEEVAAEDAAPVVLDAAEVEAVQEEAAVAALEEIDEDNAEGELAKLEAEINGDE